MADSIKILYKESKNLMNFIEFPRRNQKKTEILLDNYIKELIQLNHLEFNTNSSQLYENDYEIDDIKTLKDYQKWKVIDDQISKKLSYFNSFNNPNELIDSLLVDIHNADKNYYKKINDNFQNSHSQIDEDIVEETQSFHEDDENENEENDEDSFNMENFEKFNEEVEEEDKDNDNDNNEDEEEEEEELDYEEYDDKELKYNDIFTKVKKNKVSNDDKLENEIFNIEHSYYENSKSELNTISNLEERLIGEKDWTMKGEITGKYRPVNSLLENNLDFKVTKRPPPIPSVEWSNKIENLIRIRVSNDLYDDPKMSTMKEEKKSNNLNDQLIFEKSNKGLAELYEEDWYKENQNESLKEVKSQEKQEIEGMIEELFDMFGKLTSNQFVGERVKTEMNLVKDVESIEVKDVSKNVISDKYIRSDFDKKIEEYNPIKTEKTTNTEMEAEENKKRHRQMKRKVKKKLYLKEMKRKEKMLMKEYDSKFEVKLAMKQQKDKIENKNIKQKDLKSKVFFSNIQENEKNKSLKYIKNNE